jgi:hypothetical protein
VPRTGSISGRFLTFARLASMILHDDYTAITHTAANQHLALI